MELSEMLKLTNFRSICVGALASTMLACTSTTPQLTDARKAYQEAEESPARTRAPGALSEARVSLDRAEQAHDQNPGSDHEADLAERAERKAHYAQMRGEAREVRADERAEVHAEHVARDQRVGDRRDAKHEKRASAALQSLAQVANVKEESRGYVITLSGSLLFPNGKEEVSPVANNSLTQVADALAQQPSDTTFEVEGYTDNSGSDDQNRALSEKRAQAVADKLSQAGIDRDRIKVVGRGEDAPIADNNTAEGRASNRRVEIIVDRNDRS